MTKFLNSVVVLYFGALRRNNGIPSYHCMGSITAAPDNCFFYRLFPSKVTRGSQHEAILISTLMIIWWKTQNNLSLDPVSHPYLWLSYTEIHDRHLKTATECDHKTFWIVYCKTLNFGRSKFSRFLWVDLFADFYFRGFLVSEKKKKKTRFLTESCVSYACEFYTVIYQFYTVIFKCFPHCIVHDRWVNTNQFYCYLMKQILSYYLIFYRDNSSLIIPVLKKQTVWRCDTFLLSDWITYCIELTGRAVNQLPIIHAIFDNYCHGVFSFIQPCWAKWLPNAIDKLSKVKDLIFIFFTLAGIA